jgi:hypothetical protein
VEQLKRRIGAHNQQIQAVFQAIRQLVTPPESKERKIGFIVKQRAGKYGRPEISPRR